MNPRVENGWLVIDCDAPDTTPVYLGVGKVANDMRPAFRDFSASGARTAKVQVPLVPGRTLVHVRVGAVTSIAGVVVV